MKLRLYFEPLTIEIPHSEHDDIYFENLSHEELMAFVLEDWEHFIEHITPMLGAVAVVKQ